jgi:type I restriction enzyme S subunit
VTPDFKPYPEYKDSGLPWLGQIPANWGLVRAKRLFRKMERPIRLDDEVITCFRDGTVTLRKNRRLRGFTESLKEIGYQGIRRGDLVIHQMDGFAGAIGVSDSDGKGSPIYSICEPIVSLNTHYYAQVLREMARSQYIVALARGIRERSSDFRFDTFATQYFPLPPLKEQNLIADIIGRLDQHTRRYIRVKRRQIKLLNEQKHSIIYQAVTRGLDPKVRLKPSGVEWLGDVPEHWKISRIKNEFINLNNIRVPISSVERGKMNSRLFDYYGASGVIDKVDNYLFDDELILIAEDGANLVLRNLPLVIIARGKFWVNNHAHILKPKRGSIEYLVYALEMINYRPWISGAAQPKLTKDRLMSILLPIPPDIEQTRILDKLKIETDPLKLIVEKAYKEINLIREYHSRLIADVVTGRLDVRGVDLPTLLEAEPIEPEAEIEDVSEGEFNEESELVDVEEVRDADD